MSHLSGAASRPAPAVDLQIPVIEAHDLAGWQQTAPGQVLELPDGQRLVVAGLWPDRPDAALLGVRIAGPRQGVLPLGESVTLSAAQLGALAPLRVLGAWYAPAGTPAPQQIVVEAIRRGLITSHTCGVPWPLGNSMQLSAEAADRIEQYLFEVARSTGCAFPFHDIAEAIRKMHLCPRPDNPSLCDILSAEELAGRRAMTDDELLCLWARELRRRIHTSDWLPPPL